MIVKIGKRMEFQVILSMLLGAAFACFFPSAVSSIIWIGELFIKLLTMFLAPLLFLSILSAVIGLGDIKKLGVIGLRTVFYYMVTTFLAIMLSLLLMNIFKPGKLVNFKELEGFNSAGVEGLSFISFITNLIPSNVIDSFVKLNAMQIVVIGIILGLFMLISSKKEKLKDLKSIVDTLNNAILAFIGFVVKLTPFGVFAIIAGIISLNGFESIQNLFPLVAISIFALFIHALVILPLFGFFLGRFDASIYFREVKDAILLGFSTASSSAAMGLTMKLSRENAKLSNEVVDFSVPLGTTINMNGTALYQALVTLFIAQSLSIDLNFAQQLAMVIMVILASVGAAGVPGAGILILTTVFISLGLPVEAIAIILAVDRILDMFRTGVNVWGDLIVAKVVDRFYKIDLLKKSERKKYFLNLN